ncbi:ATP-binding protein [Microbacterium forte]
MKSEDRATWTITTHDWARDVDVDHLHGIRDERAMYEPGGRRHQILEVLAYADDEAAGLGRIGHVVVSISRDGSVSVADDGRGTDTRTDGGGDIVRKPVMATRDVRFFESASAPLLPDGLPRRGMSTVSALSSVLAHENRRADGRWVQEYHHGVPSTDLRILADPAEVSPGAGAGTGTTVTFRSELGDPTDLSDTDLTAFRWVSIRVVREG